MKRVYKLEHKRVIEFDYIVGEKICDTKILGFFSTKEKCQQVISSYIGLPGFKKYPNDFVIEKVEADIDDFNDIVGDFKERVFYLSHEYYDGDYDYVSNLGYYSSKEKAINSLERIKKQTEFSEHQEGFNIDCYEINKQEWSEGFCPIDEMQ